MAESNLNAGVIFDVDNHYVLVRGPRNQDGYWLDDGIALQMFERAKQSEMKDITLLGESKALCPSWEIHPLKDLWYFFKKIQNKSEGDKKTPFQDKIRLLELKNAILDSQKQPDFCRYVCGRKVTNSERLETILRMFGWTKLSPNLEIKDQNFITRVKKFQTNKEYLRGAAVCFFHYHTTSSIQLLQCLLEDSEYLEGKDQQHPKERIKQEVNAMLKYLSSYADVQKQWMNSPQLNAAVQQQNFETFTLKDSSPSQASIMGEVFEIRGMLKMLVQQIRNVEFKIEYLDLIKEHLCGHIDPKKVLLYRKISIMDRIPYLLRFYPEELLSVLDSTIEKSIGEGYLEFISMLENEMDIMELVQSYLDSSSDIQATAAIGLKLLQTGLVSSEQNLSKCNEWYLQYKNFLNKNRLYSIRAKTEEVKIKIFMERLKSTKEDQTRDSELWFFCSFCRNPFSVVEYLSAKKQGKDMMNVGKEGSSLSQKQHTQSCPSCTKQNNPLCSICYLPMSFASPAEKLREKLKINTNKQGGPPGSQQQPADQEDQQFATFDQAVIICVNCHHGGHAPHIEKWFESHDECPVPNCKCHCGQV